MKLGSETLKFLDWLRRVARVLVRVRALVSVAAVGSAFMQRITGILAFVLPLKVILLAGSDGVARWAEPVVGSGGKELLVGILIAVAVLCFFASIALNTVSDRLAAAIGDAVLRRSNELAVVGNQSAEARTSVSHVMSFAAGALFVLSGVAVIGLINPSLIAILLAIIAAQAMLTSRVLANADRLNPGVLARFIKDDAGGYLNILSSVNFLLAFGVLVYPFLSGAGGSVIVAIVSVILLRRVLSEAVITIRGALRLIDRQRIINAIVFPEHQFRKGQHSSAATMRALLDKEARQARTLAALRSAGYAPSTLDVRWHDSAIPGVYLLAVHASDSMGAHSRYQLQVYWPKHDHRLENEAVLFRYIPREQVAAPAVVARFTEGRYPCQLVWAGKGTMPPPKEWTRQRDSLLEYLIGLQPCDDIIRAYRASHPLMADRLSSELVERLEWAVDDDDERAVYDAFRERLPAIREHLRACPLYLHNPELKRGNVLEDVDGSPMVMTWGNWSLEPVGIEVPDKGNPADLERAVRVATSSRTDCPQGYGVDHLTLVRTLAQIERKIMNNQLKVALECVGELLANPLLAAAQAPRATMDELPEVGDAT